jgi:hypothetical protein
MDNSFFQLNKKTLLRNVTVSLMLSASLIISVINHASYFTLGTVGFSSLLLTLLYIAVWAVFEVRATLKSRKGFVILCRTWFVLGMICCAFNAVATLASLTLSGAAAYIASFFVTAFVAPMYGFYIFGNSTVGVMIAAFLLYLGLCFVPELTRYCSKRRNIKKMLK